MGGGGGFRSCAVAAVAVAFGFSLFLFRAPKLELTDFDALGRVEIELLPRRHQGFAEKCIKQTKNGNYYSAVSSDLVGSVSITATHRLCSQKKKSQAHLGPGNIIAPKLPFDEANKTNKQKLAKAAVDY